MNIEKNTVVEMHYTLKDNTGEIIDTTDGDKPMPFIQGIGNIIPGLEKKLEGKKIGDKIQAKIKPEDAYGLYDKNLKQTVSLENFEHPNEVEKGIQFHMMVEEIVKIASVTKVEGDDVHVDLNHPLADVELNFDVEIMSIREATEDELKHGHVHGEGCSH